THVDLDDVDALVLGALHQLGIGLYVRIVNDDRRRFFGEPRGKRLWTGTRTPVRVAHDDLHAVGLELLLDAGEPAFGQVKVHGDRNVGHRLAGQGLLEGRLEGLIEPLCGGRQYRERAERRGPGQTFRHVQ